MPYSGSYDTAPVLSWWGKGGFVLSFIVFVVLALLPGSVAVPDSIVGSGYGVCLPSVSSWPLDATASMWINMSLIAGAAVYSIFVTKHFNFVPADNLLYAISLLLMCGATPWTTEKLNPGVLMLLLVLVCLNIIFSLYGRRNCAEGIFLVFSFLSFGSMVQYAFLLLIPVFLLGCVFLRSMRIREVVAMLLGIAAPYWILLATGVVKFSEFHLPALTNLFSGAESPMDLFRLLLTVAISGLIFLFALLVNSMRHASAGVMARARWSFIHLLGFSLLWFMVFDFTNLLVYLPSFFLTVGYECSLWGMRLRVTQRHYLALSLFVAYISLSVVFACL